MNANKFFTDLYNNHKDFFEYYLSSFVNAETERDKAAVLRQIELLRKFFRGLPDEDENKKRYIDYIDWIEKYLKGEEND